MLSTSKSKHYAAALLLALTLLLQGTRWMPQIRHDLGGGIAPAMVCPGESDGDVCE